MTILSVRLARLTLFWLGGLAALLMNYCGANSSPVREVRPNSHPERFSISDFPEPQTLGFFGRNLLIGPEQFRWGSPMVGEFDLAVWGQRVCVLYTNSLPQRVTWYPYGYEVYGDRIYLRCSEDGGHTWWQKPTVLPRREDPLDSTCRLGITQRLALTPTGRMVALFNSGRSLCSSVSDDGGRSFSEALIRRFPEKYAGLDLGGVRVAPDGTIYALVSFSPRDPEIEYQLSFLRLVRSDDGGLSWSEMPIDPEMDRWEDRIFINAALALDDSGAIFVLVGIVEVNLIDIPGAQPSQFYLYKSSDKGVSFSLLNDRVNQEPIAEGMAQLLNGIKMDVDHAGRIHIAYLGNALEQRGLPNWKVMYVVSNDGGLSFPPPTRVSPLPHNDILTYFDFQADRRTGRAYIVWGDDRDPSQTGNIFEGYPPTWPMLSWTETSGGPFTLPVNLSDICSPEMYCDSFSNFDLEVDENGFVHTVWAGHNYRWKWETFDIGLEGFTFIFYARGKL